MTSPATKPDESGRTTRTTLTRITRAAGAPVRPAAPIRLCAALAAAEQLLTRTADTINPGTSAPEVLACLTRYRSHLSALVAASKPAATQDINPAQ